MVRRSSTDARRRALCLCAAVAWGVAREAAAQPAPDDGLIVEGVELRRARRDAEALERFQRAYALRATPRALAQIGLAEQALGRWVDADTHLRQAVVSVDDPWIQHTRPMLDDALAAIARRVGWLALSGNVAGAQVRVNDRQVGVMPLASALSVPAGEVTVQVVAEGYYPITRQVNVTAGESLRESVELVPIPRVAPAVEPVRRGEQASTRPVAPTSSRDDTSRVNVAIARPNGERSSSDLRRTLGWIGAGSAVLFGGLGLASLLGGNGEITRYNADACLPFDGRTRGEACGALLDEGRVFQALGVGGLAVGGALGVASMFLFATSRGRSAVARRVVACAPDLPTGGILCIGSF